MDTAQYQSSGPRMSFPVTALPSAGPKVAACGYPIPVAPARRVGLQAGQTPAHMQTKTEHTHLPPQSCDADFQACKPPTPIRTPDYYASLPYLAFQIREYLPTCIKHPTVERHISLTCFDSVCIPFYLPPPYLAAWGNSIKPKHPQTLSLDSHPEGDVLLTPLILE